MKWVGHFDKLPKYDDPERERMNIIEAASKPINVTSLEFLQVERHLIDRLI